MIRLQRRTFDVAKRRDIIWDHPALHLAEHGVLPLRALGERGGRVGRRT